MKFLLHEHKAVTDAIAKRNMAIDDFSFVKKHGNLNVIYQGKQAPFTFHRKRQTTLDTNKQWQTEVVYYHVISKRKEQVDNFEALMIEFEKWLAGLE